MTLEKQQSFEDNPLWKLKVRLQFSGWLQYIIHAIWVLIMLIITGGGWLIGWGLVVGVVAVLVGVVELEDFEPGALPEGAIVLDAQAGPDQDDQDDQHALFLNGES